MAVAVGFAIPLGIIAAARAGTGIDRMATTLALLGISVPNFWLGPLLAIVFSVTLGWLPVSGRGTPAHLVLPAITLGAPLAAVLARMTRASVLEELRELYVLAARARGVSRARAILFSTRALSRLRTRTFTAAPVRHGTTNCSASTPRRPNWLI